MLSLFSISTALLAAAPSVLAWGELGHETVGYVADAFLGPKTKTFVNTYLDASYNGSLGPAGPWADQVKYSSAYSWSQDWHYIDAEDDPLGGSCSVVPSRDCGDTGCLLSAIANYTQRVHDGRLTAAHRDEALKFLVHFFGDITQPLHCEAYEVGGNDISVTYDSDDTELHAVWDTSMIETLLDGTYDSSVTKFASAIVSKIQSGLYESDKASWVACDDPTEGSSATYLTCPTKWAADSNAFDCSTVFKGYNVSDLYPSYYKANIDTVELQLAKGGYRLAAWLNMIFDGTAFPSGD